MTCPNKVWKLEQNSRETMHQDEDVTQCLKAARCQTEFPHYV